MLAAYVALQKPFTFDHLIFDKALCQQIFRIYFVNCLKSLLIMRDTKFFDIPIYLLIFCLRFAFRRIRKSIASIACRILTVRGLPNFDEISHYQCPQIILKHDKQIYALHRGGFSVRYYRNSSFLISPLHCETKETEKEMQ